MGDVNSQKSKENKNPNQHIVIVEDNLREYDAMQCMFKRLLFSAIHVFPICLLMVTSITETQNALEATSQHSHPQKQQVNLASSSCGFRQRHEWQILVVPG